MQNNVFSGREGNPICKRYFPSEYLYLYMKFFRHTPDFLLLLGLVFISSSHRMVEQPLIKDPRLYATAWFAVSAEKHAIYMQTYKMASLQLTLRKEGRQKAVVADLDETVFDNSAWALRVLLEGKEYPAYWDEWEQAAIAPAFAGAVEFFQNAATSGMQVFYVSNRSQKNLGRLLKNLNGLGLPFADSAHVLLKENTSSKVARRKKIEQDYDISLLLGDNLADFDGVWENAETARRHLQVEANAKNWGRKFIIFPNPMYGSWEDAMMGYRRDLNEAATDSAWKATLVPYSKMARW